MFNNVKRFLTVSIRNRENCLIRLTRKNVLSVKFQPCANTWCLGDVVYKRFYCHVTTNESNPTSTDLKNQQLKLYKQKLDEFLSNPENKKRFQLLELEVDVLRHNGLKVPNHIEPKDWLNLLKSTKSGRRKYLEFLWRNEKTTENKKARKEAKQVERLAKIEAEKQIEDNGEIKYGLLHNTIFMRIYDTTINHFYNSKLIQAMMFEPKIVFDCSYENDMRQREIHNCAKQMALAFAINRAHVDPMALYFCNFNNNGLLKQHLHQNIPTLLNDDFPVIIEPKSYLDIFSKNELVYLTPHCRTNLIDYDPNTVYIIGAFVDKSVSLPLSMAKAKKEGIRMARFPIDRYLTWGSSSSKNLTLDQSLRIILDLRHTGNWTEALKNVPVRKLKSAREYMLQQKLQKSMSLNTPETQEPEVPAMNFTFQSRKLN